MKIKFSSHERNNTFRPSGKEWVLTAQIDDNNPWTIYAWEKRPRNEIIEAMKKAIFRSCEFYHVHMKKQRFDLEEEEKTWT